MTDRITAILEVLRAAEYCERMRLDKGRCTESPIWDAVEALRLSSPPDFTKLVIAALPCSIGQEEPCPDHPEDCPAHYRPGVIELISVILSESRTK